MSLKKRILTGIGALAFMALMALNLELVNAKQKDGLAAHLTLSELTAKAGGGGEDNTGDDVYDPANYCWKECHEPSTTYCVVGTRPGYEYWCD